MDSARYRRVAVVGAGVSGVVAAAHLNAAGLEVVVFERSSAAGGVWLHDSRIPAEPDYPSMKPSEVNYFSTQPEKGRRDSGVDESRLLQHAPPGPCYDGLMNNVSTPMMRTTLHPWPEGTQDFVKHYVLRDYIQDMSKRTGVEDMTFYDTSVQNIEKDDDVWNVETVTTSADPESTHPMTTRRHWVFDAVVVASGHYHSCKIPDTPGLREWKELWPSRIMHSKSYRRPDSFQDQNVLLVGAGVSSHDIAKELSPVTNTIYQVSRGGMYDLPAQILPHNAVRIGEIASFETPTGNTRESLAQPKPDEPMPLSVRLKSGQILCGIHRIILCTGYHTSYPFLRQYHNDDLTAAEADDRLLVTDGSQIHNLHRDIFYIPDPSLAFVGVPYYTATFSLFEFIAIAVAAVFSGRARLPSTETMREEYAAKLQRLRHGRQFNSLKGVEVDYVNELLAWINKDGEAVGEAPIAGHSAEWHMAREAQLEMFAVLFGGIPGSAAGNANCPAVEKGLLPVLGTCG